MGALTAARPKPMVEVAGRPLVDHALAQFQDLTQCLANTHYLPEALEAHLTARGVAVLREAELLETGGGLKAAAPLLARDAVYTMNTDSVWIGPRAMDGLAALWRPEEMDALLLTVPLSHTRGHLGDGDFDLCADGRISRGGAHVYTGLQIIKTETVCALAETVFSMNAVWDRMHRAGRLFGARYDGIWCDVGHPEGVTIAENELARAGMMPPDA